MAPRLTLAGSDSEILSFATPSTLGLSTAHSAEDCCSLVSTGSSQNVSTVVFQTPITPGSVLGSPFVAEQQEATHNGKGRLRSQVDMGPMLAHFVLVLDPNKYLHRTMFSSVASATRGDVRSCPSRMSRIERIVKALDILKAGRLSPFDLVLEVLDDDNADYSGYQNELYKINNNKLQKILDSIIGTRSGKQKLWSWMQPHALEIVCEAIDGEMDTVTKGELLPGLSAITSDFIKSWTVGDVSQQAPILTAVLIHAAQTSVAKETNKKKNPDAVCIENCVISRVLMFYGRCATSW